MSALCQCAVLLVTSDCESLLFSHLHRFKLQPDVVNSTDSIEHPNEWMSESFPASNLIPVGFEPPDWLNNGSTHVSM